MSGGRAAGVSGDLFPDPDPHADLRARWRDLVERRLPEAARERPDWPVRLDHCFARILLDCVHDRPWREVVRPPAWRNTDPATLERAVALGCDILANRADLSDFNQRSLELRGKVPSG